MQLNIPNARQSDLHEPENVDVIPSTDHLPVGHRRRA
jgi:hypothetical protein